MTTWKKKLGLALGGLALVTGAVPGTIGTASAYGSDKQHLIRGKTILAGLLVGALIGGFLVLKNNDHPVSP